MPVESGVEYPLADFHDWGALISSVMVADLAYTPGQSLDKLYEQKPPWKVFQDRDKAVSFLFDAGAVIELVYPPRMKTKLRPENREYFG